MELIEGVVTRDGKATVRAGGESVQLTAPGADLKAARDAVLASAKDAVRERGEVCRLEITDNGRREMAQLQSARNEVLARAMAGMTDDELRALRAAVPALRSLRAQLESLDESSASRFEEEE